MLHVIVFIYVHVDSLGPIYISIYIYICIYVHIYATFHQPMVNQWFGRLVFYWCLHVSKLRCADLREKQWTRILVVGVIKEAMPAILIVTTHYENLSSPTKGLKLSIFFSRSWGSIVAAVEKGRAIYSGIQKFVGEPRASHFIYNVGIYQV